MFTERERGGEKEKRQGRERTREREKERRQEKKKEGKKGRLIKKQTEKLCHSGK